MKRPDPSWLKDRRVIVLGIGCALVGFLLALLIFGKPWHLPSDWGDIPTWLAVLVPSVGGWVALSQLRQQQKVIEDDIARSQKRDELLDRQLRELDNREKSGQREQAEQVNLVPWPIRLPKPTEDPAAKGETAAARRKEERSGSCRVTNGSRRPVRRVACRLILDGRDIRAGSFGLGGSFSGSSGIREQPMFFPVNADDVNRTAGEYLHLLAGQEIMASLTIPEEIDSYQAAKYLIRFTDDAKRRWDLTATCTWNQLQTTSGSRLFEIHRWQMSRRWPVSTTRITGRSSSTG